MPDCAWATAGGKAVKAIGVCPAIVEVIAGPARSFDGIDLSPGDFATRGDHVTNAGAAACAKIVKFALGCVQSQNMRSREIENVNVVANTGAIQSFIIRPVNFYVWLLAKRNLEHVGN